MNKFSTFTDQRDVGVYGYDVGVHGGTPAGKR